MQVYAATTGHDQRSEQARAVRQLITLRAVAYALAVKEEVTIETSALPERVIVDAKALAPRTSSSTTTRRMRWPR
jgi:hypothetical protein